MANKIIEKIEFLTQIHTAWDGTEQRMALRKRPRRYIAYDYIGVETWQSQYLKMLSFGRQTQLIRFPLWHAAIPLQEDAYLDQANLHVAQNALWGFREVGAVELWKNDEHGGVKYDLKYLTASGILGFTKQLTADWEKYKTTLIPVFYGILQNEENYTAHQSNLATLALELMFHHNQNAPQFPDVCGESFDEATPDSAAWHRGLPERYMSAELFRFVPQWEKDISADFSRNFNRMDNETGAVRYDLKSIETAENRTIQYAAFSREEIHNLQRFFYRHKGRLKSFYMPSWMNDIVLEGDQPSGQIYLFAKFPMYWKYYSKSKRRKTIAVFYKNGEAEILQIAGYSVDESGMKGKIFLEAPLKKSLLKKTVAMICFLYRCRFTSDTLTTDYESPSIAVIQLGFTEVDA